MKRPGATRPARDYDSWLGGEAGEIDNPACRCGHAWDDHQGPSGACEYASCDCPEFEERDPADDAPDPDWP